MAPTKKRKSYTAEFKLKVCELAETSSNRNAAAHFGIDEKNVRNWRKGKPVLEKMKKTIRARRFRAPKWPELERDLKQWILDLRYGRSKVRVTTTRIKLKALIMAKERNIKDFTASRGWFENFKVRNGLSVRMRTSVGQPLPQDWETKVTDFLSYVATKMGNVKPENLINMDEVPCCFDLPGNRTIDLRGAEDITVNTTGSEKTRFTLVLAVSASGEKLAPMIVFKRKTMPKGKFPSGIVVKVNPKGWINSTLMEDWMSEIWKKRKSAFFKKPKQEECLLIYDACRAHLTDEVKNIVQRSTKLAVIPGGLTKKLQPLDISVNKSFKDKLRAKWDEWISDELSATYTRGEKRQRASYETVCEWVMSAWNEIPVTVIKNGFKKAGLYTYDSEVQQSLEEALEVEGDDDSEVEHGAVETNETDFTGIEVYDSDFDKSLSGDEFDGFESDVSEEM